MMTYFLPSRKLNQPMVHLTEAFITAMWPVMNSHTLFLNLLSFDSLTKEEVLLCEHEIHLKQKARYALFSCYAK